MKVSWLFLSGLTENVLRFSVVVVDSSQTRQIARVHFSREVVALV